MKKYKHFLHFGDIKNRKQDNNTQDCEEENKMEKPMNKMEDMEMDMVAGGRGRGGFRRPKSNANSMAAKVDINKTQNASGWLGPCKGKTGLIATQV